MRYRGLLVRVSVDVGSVFAGKVASVWIFMWGLGGVGLGVFWSVSMTVLVVLVFEWAASKARCRFVVLCSFVERFIQVYPVFKNWMGVSGDAPRYLSWG